jgi:hypothetical protein
MDEMILNAMRAVALLDATQHKRASPDGIRVPVSRRLRAGSRLSKRGARPRSAQFSRFEA